MIHLGQELTNYSPGAKIWSPASFWVVFLSSVQFTHSVVSDSLQPHGLQHSRLPCLSPTPRPYSNSCPSSRWCYTTISYSVDPFSSHLQSVPTSGSFPMSQFLTSWQKYWSFSFNISPSNEYSGMISFRIGSPCSPRDLKSLLQHHSSKASVLWCSTLWSNSHIHTWLLGKP